MRPALRALRALRALPLLLLAACGPWWGRVGTVETVTYDAEDRFQLWRQGNAIQLHAVRVTDDSILGISDCAPTLTFAFARREVDSLRLAHSPGAGGVVLGAVAGAVGMLVLITSQLDNGT